jgi:hypothetical protein
MLLQIAMDYPSLPDLRTLKLHEIRFFYEGIRASLHERAKRRREQKSREAKKK